MANTRTTYQMNWRHGRMAAWRAYAISLTGLQCYICKTTEGRLVVDHDMRKPCHPNPGTGTSPYCNDCIRGILCHRCNIVVGFLEQRPDLLDAVVAYSGAE